MDAPFLALAEKAVFSTHTLTEDERARAGVYIKGLSVRTDQRLGRVQRLILRYFWGLY